MIASFKDKRNGSSLKLEQTRRFHSIARIAVRKLTQLDVAERLMDLKFPPGNRLEALKGGRSGQHSIRINDQFRICFRWTEDGIYDVEITDYH